MSLRFAIIGCGAIAHRHAAAIIKTGSIVAVSDVDASKASKLAADYQCPYFLNIDQVLALPNVDVMVICTPNYLHAPQSIAALKSGKHVLCEKPMCLTLAEAEAMIAAEILAKKKLFVVKQNRFNEPVTLLKQLIDGNKLGQLLSFQVNCFWNRPAAYYQQSNWKGRKKLDGGILFTQFSHFIDIITWLLGPAAVVKGFGSNLTLANEIEGEETGVVSLQMKNGALGSLHYTVTAHHKNYEGSITIAGEKGLVKIGGQYLNELSYYAVENLEAPILEKNTAANDYGFYKGSMSNHPKVYEELEKALHDQPHQLPAATETKECIELIIQIMDAINSNH
jgi:UDP-N-acetyl-2-amino-2-deoxyglucuronate dehydrogenase